jgi:2-methylcitrate dehydratase PrpD
VAGAVDAPGTFAQRIARFAAAIDPTAVPAPVLDKVQAILLYGLTVAVAEYDETDQVQLAMPRIHGAPGESLLFSSTQTRSAADAAAINAARMFARNQVDTHADCCGHVGCVVIPAVLALAQERKVEGERVVAALLAGLEVPPRVGRSAMTSSVARGLRGTSVFGVFGAAVAAGIVIGLDAARLAHAVAIAASYAAGVTQCFADGTQEAPLHIAHASRAGVVAALLAEQGVLGAPLALEGRSGFYRAFSDSPPSLDLTGWAVLGVTFKPVSGCVINQQVVQALADLRSDENLSPARVRAVRVALNPGDAAYPGIQAYGPFETRQGACMSTAFMAQLAVENGTVRFSDFSQRHGPDPLHERSRAVSVVADDSLADNFTCRVFVDLDDGTTLRRDATDPQRMNYSLEETVRLCKVIAREWRFAGEDGKSVDALAGKIADLVTRRAPGSAQALGAWLAAAR